MNWIFETYSNVYNAAMMQHGNQPEHVACAKSGGEPKTSPFARLLGRR